MLTDYDDRLAATGSLGDDRGEAEAVRRRLDLEPRDSRPTIGGPITLARFLNETWLPRNAARYE